MLARSAHLFAPAYEAIRQEDIPETGAMDCV